MSFLEKEEGKQSSFWDWVVGIGLIVVIGGFIIYYQYQKRTSAARFKQADSLYQAGNFRDASKAYEELKSAQYLTTHDDSTIYARMDTIETDRESATAQLAKIKARLQSHDTANVAQELSNLRFKELLSSNDSLWIDSVKNAMPAKPTVAPSTSAAAASAPTVPSAKAPDTTKAKAKP